MVASSTSSTAVNLITECVTAAQEIAVAPDVERIFPYSHVNYQNGSR
jgi:hypothetical protein